MADGLLQEIGMNFLEVESGEVDVIVMFEGERFLARAIRAFSHFRLELHVISI
jgi:hypothetical protein